MVSARYWRRWSRGVRWACVAALVLVAARVLPAPDVRTTARFPRTEPRKLAHMLADFSTHLLLYPHLGEWSLEDEASNYTSWRYTVSYACGPRCSGRASVLARDEWDGDGDGTGHDMAGRDPSAYTVRVAHRTCWTGAVLFWLQHCEEWETETRIIGDSVGGAVLDELARGDCSDWRALLPLGCVLQLRARRDEHLQRLRALLRYTSA